MSAPWASDPFAAPRAPAPRGGVPRKTHLFALSAFALAQPLFAKLGPAPGWFAAHGMTSLELVLLAVGLVAVPALALIAIEGVTGVLGRRVRWVVHLLLVAALVALIALPPLGGLASGVAYALALLVGLGFAAAYARFRGVRAFVTALGFAPFLFLAVFLLASPTSKLVLGNQLDAWRADDSFRPPVVFLQLDALPSLLLQMPDHRVDATRYPTFARLAREGVWYRNASNVHENTVFSVPSFIDGKLPAKGIAPVVQDHFPNLFTLTGPGYRMNVAEEATTLCPLEFCARAHEDYGSVWKDTRTVLNQIVRPHDARKGLPSIQHRWVDYRAGPLKTNFVTHKKTPGFVIRHLHAGRIGRFERWLSQVGRGGARPELDYIHMFLPHEPREFLPDGKRYVTPNAALEGPPAYNNRFLSEQEEQRTLLQLGYTDRVVGQVVERLKRLGIYDDALVVVVADHGESFVPPKASPAGPFVPGHLGYRRAVTHRNLADIGSIPMFIKYPKGQGPTGVDDRFVRSVDVFPTIAMVLGLPLPGLDGRDLRDPAYRGHSDVLVESTFGGPVRMSTTRWQRARDVSLRRRLRLFGSGKHSLYVWGVNARLVGQAVPAVLPAPAPAGVPAPPGAPATTGGTTPDATTTGGTTPTAFASVPHATIVHASAFAHVDPTATVCACQIGGRITGADPKGMQLAVAINGTVVATVEGFTSRGGLNWSAVVPPTAFRDGDNRVQVYRVENGELAQELS